jgi:nucleoside-diphosphate-sugar epimerase
MRGDARFARVVDGLGSWGTNQAIRTTGFSMTTIGITSVGSGIGQSVLRSLALGDAPVRTVGMDVSPANSGIHWVDVPLLIPPVRAHDDHRRAIFEAVREHRIDVLIPGNDNELGPLAAWRDELDGLGCTTIVSSPEAIRLSTDKLAMAQWCAERDLPFVATWTATDARSRASALRYPLIAKPRSGSASDGIALIPDEAALVAMTDDDIVVQPYLPPVSRELQADSTARLEQHHEVSAQYLLGRSGRILGSFVSINRLKAGIPIEIVPVDDEPWAQDGRPLIEHLASIGAVGPVNLQGRLTTDGRIVFFEANLRFTGITGIRSMMGYREVEATLSSLVAGDDAAAVNLLRRAPGLVGYRHTGDAVVPESRVAQLARSGRAAVERRQAPPRSVVITGGTGYLGRAVIDGLLSDPRTEHLHVVVRPGTDLGAWPADRVSPVLGDLLDDGLRLPEADALLHVAALRPAADLEPPAHGLFETNVEGTVRIARAARAAGIRRFVFASSQAVYGTARAPLWSESLSLRPETDYAITKALGEAALRAFEDLEVIALRIGRLYGSTPQMRWSELPHKLALQIVRGEAIEIDGDGHQRMDLVHVADGAAALVAAAAAPAAPGLVALNIGGGSPVSVLQLAQLLSAASERAGGPPAEVRHRDAAAGPRPSFGMHIRRARALLDWSPRVTLERAADELIAAARALVEVRR